MKASKQVKTKQFNMDMRKKLVILFVMVLLAFVVLGVRLVLINTQKGDEYTHTVLSQRHYDSIILPYQRGSIVDSKGTTLAVSKKVYNVILDVSVMNYYENRKEGTVTATLNALQTCFGLSAQEMAGYVAQNPNSKYYVLKKRLDYEEIQPFIAMVEEAAASEEMVNIRGVWFEEEYLRYYPLGSVACDVLGYTNAGNAGAYGLEEYYNDTLNGTNGREYGYLNEDSNLERTTIPAVDGNTIVTTIDANIQKIVEKKLADFNNEYANNYREGEDGSYNTGCIIMEVNTGKILAMASYPSFDLNEPRNIGLYFTPEEIAAAEENGLTEGDLLAELWKNYCISATYEPGSVAKPFTVAMALDSGAITGNETYYCGGLLEIGGYKIRCHNRYGDGEITVPQAVAQSCNVALMHIGQAMGEETYLKYFEEFNFGLKTNIDLTGEARTASLVFSRDTMGPTELATSTFGQGYNVTMIQMISAFCSLVNGGYYYEPHMVSQILSADGSVIRNIEPRLLKQTISGTTSDKIIEYCNEVVISGTGKKARPAGYAIGGKTGTAETVPRKMGNYVVSFMGYAPADDPQIAIYVVIDRPNLPDQSTGTGQACLITKEILTEVLPYLNIFMTEELSEKEIEDLKERGLYDATIIKPDEEEESEDETSEESSQTPQKPDVKIDPATGYAIDPYTGEYLDPETGRPINPNSSFMQGDSTSQ